MREWWQYRWFCTTHDGCVTHRSQEGPSTTQSSAENCSRISSSGCSCAIIIHSRLGFFSLSLSDDGNSIPNKTTLAAGQIVLSKKILAAGPFSSYVLYGHVRTQSKLVLPLLHFSSPLRQSFLSYHSSSPLLSHGWPIFRHLSLSLFSWFRGSGQKENSSSSISLHRQTLLTLSIYILSRRRRWSVRSSFFPVSIEALVYLRKTLPGRLLLLFQSTEPLTSYFLFAGRSESDKKPSQSLTCIYIYLRLNRPPFNTRQHPSQPPIDNLRAGLVMVIVYNSYIYGLLSRTAVVVVVVVVVGLGSNPHQQKLKNGIYSVTVCQMMEQIDTCFLSLFLARPMAAIGDAQPHKKKRKERKRIEEKKGDSYICLFGVITLHQRDGSTQVVLYMHDVIPDTSFSLSRTQPRYIHAFKKKKKKRKRD